MKQFRIYLYVHHKDGCQRPDRRNMSFCQEKFLCHFQLLEDDDGANCERSDKLLAELRKQVNICDLDGTFFFCIFCCMDWKEAARKGFGCKAALESMGLFKTLRLE